MDNEFDIKWMDEKIEKLPSGNGLYKFFCLILFKRRMTYSNMYVFLYALHKSKYKDNELDLKEKIIKELASIYYYNNKKLPYGFEIKR
jgi:hypothetical protein